MSIANSLVPAAPPRLTVSSSHGVARGRVATTMHTISRTLPSTVPSSARSMVDRVRHRASGQVMAMVGSFNILLGTLLTLPRRTALGHRQRVIGVLQSNCEVDRRAANAFVDRWMSKHPHFTPTRTL